MIPRLPQYIHDMGFNQRVFTLGDFHQIINREKIILTVGDFDARGMFFIRRGHPVIVLNSSLPDGLQLETAFHELSHYWLDEPGFSVCDPAYISKAEYQAQRIAGYFLIPTALLMDATIEDLMRDYGYSKEFCWFRKRIFENDSN